MVPTIPTIAPLCLCLSHSQWYRPYPPSHLKTQQRSSSDHRPRHRIACKPSVPFDDAFHNASAFSDPLPMVPTIPTIASKDPTETFFRSSDHRPRHPEPLCLFQTIDLPQTTDIKFLRPPTTDLPISTSLSFHSSSEQNRRPICRGSHPGHGPSTPNPARRERPKGLFLLAFSSFFASIRIRVKIIEGALQPSKSKSAKGGVLQILESKSTATKNLDKRVNWHSTSFEARLKRALKTESGSVDA